MSKKKILFFNSPYCGPCHNAKRALTQEVCEELNIEITYVSAEHDWNTFSTYKVISVPTFLSIDENENEIKRLEGFKSLEDIKEL
jgi:thiol-disulfide isomerase/thioredoxin